MSYDESELSQINAEPVECYIFNYNGVDYCYTSTQYPLTKYGITFQPEYIHRSETLKLNTSNSEQETCTITVSRTNNVALLYQGAPPEQDTVTVQVFRIHGTLSSDYIRILYGTVSQVRFSGSDAILTITIENVFTKNIPVGTLSYFCQNNIYDDKCCLNIDDWGLKCYIDEGWEGLTIYSANLRERDSGFFTGGFIKMGNATRQIKLHEDNRIVIKYPISKSDKEGSFMAYPGCSGVFQFCATRFNNTDNFSGIPVQQPYDVFKHPADNRHAYWVNGNVVTRDTNGAVYS